MQKGASLEDSLAGAGRLKSGGVVPLQCLRDRPDRLDTLCKLHEHSVPGDSLASLLDAEGDRLEVLTALGSRCNLETARAFLAWRRSSKARGTRP
jgi:hypothetical protein